MTGPVQITSYGVLHHDQPTGDALTVDLTAALRNPHDDPAMRYLTGLDAPVREHVLATPGAVDIVRRTVGRVTALMCFVLPGEPVNLHVYCKGGRHRSVAIAEAVAAALRDLGIGVQVTHRHIARPVVQSTPQTGGS
jgi:UPF0042 nucleotide-binding protein